MAHRDRNAPTGLAGNLTLLALSAIIGALVLVGAAALSGVYGFVRSEIGLRQADYARLVTDEVTARFGRAAELMDGVAETVVRSDGRPDRRALERTYAAGTAYIETMFILEPDATVAMSHPQPSVSLPAGIAARAVAGAGDEVRFTYSEESSGTQLRVWAYRAAGTGGHVMVASLSLKPIRDLADAVAAGRADRRVVVVQDARVLLVTGEEAGAPALTGAEYSADPGVAGTGRVRFGSRRRGEFDGAYADLRDVPGLDWRVIVGGPSSALMGDVWKALMPATVTMLVLSVLLVVLTYYTAAGLVRPLKELDARARKAHSGAYVRPIAARRADEVGSLTDTFNALVLRLNALHDVSELMASAAQMDQVLDSIITSLRHLAPSARSAVFLVDESHTRLELARTSSTEPAEERAALSLLGHSWLEDALGAYGPACATPLGKQVGPEVVASLAEVGPGSGFAVPLTAGSEHIGVMVLYHHVRPLAEAEMEMVRTFAAQAAVAIRTSRLFEMEHSSRREAEVLRAVAEQLSNPADLADAMHVVSALAGVLLGTARSGIALRDPAAFGLAPPLPDEDRAWLELWDRLEAIGLVDEDTPALIEDVTRIETVAEWAEGRDVSALALVPLLRSGAVSGVLAFEYSGAEVWIGEHRGTLARTVGRQMSLALENAALFQEARTRATNLETIFRISQAVSSALQSKVVLNRVLDVVQKIFSADAVSLMTYDAGRQLITTAMARGLVSQEMLYLETGRGEDIPGRVFDERVPIAAGDLASRTERLASLAYAQGLRSLLAVPLLARGRSIGVLSVFSREPEAFRREDVELLLTFATQAALAIDTASLFTKEHLVATVLQTSLVPEQVAEVPGLDIASEYRAGAAEAEIGGDYYDVFRAPDGRWTLVMGDVCGKGVLAATKTSMIKYTTRGLVAAGMGPAEVLTHLNDMVKDSGDAADIVTLWIGMLDIGKRTLTYGNGGHPPAILMDPRTRRGTRLSTTGPLLGAISGALFEERAVSVPAEAVLMLYTDGVTEARRGNKFFGEGRVRRALRAGGSAEAIAGRLLSALETFATNGLRDDVAVLVVRLLGDS